MDIETDRLVLRLVPLSGLAATAAGNQSAARRIIGSSLGQEWFDHAWVSDLRLKQWTANPAYGPWSIRAAALKRSGEIVGTINSHNTPMDFIHDGRTRRTIEVGYTVFMPWRRVGIAFEMVSAYASWATGKGVESVLLSIAPDNQASLGLARKLGARRIGEHVDEIDGPEDIFLFDTEYGETGEM